MKGLLRPLRSFRVPRGVRSADVRSLIAGAQVGFGKDSGRAHIAAVFGVPVMALVGGIESPTKVRA